MRPVNKFKLEFLSVPENVAFARVAVAAFASQLDYTLADLEELKVSISEVVANAIVHGYEGAPDRKVFLEAEIFDDYLKVTVRDEGKGIENINKALQPTFTTDSERMGLGFVFVKSFMDKLKIDSTPGKGTSVTLIKKVTCGRGKKRENVSQTRKNKSDSGNELVRSGDRGKSSNKKEVNTNSNKAENKVGRIFYKCESKDDAASAREN